MSSSEAAEDDLSEISFADKLLMKEKYGTKIFTEKVHSEKKANNTKSHSTSFHPRKSKHSDESPIEMPLSLSKQKIKRIREVVTESSQSRTVRDPRFDDLSGTYNETYFQQAFGFLSDIRKREKQKLIKSLKVTKDEEKRKKIQDLLISLKQQEENARIKEERKKKLKEINKKEKELIKHGKSPFYIKKCLLKKTEKEEKLNKLKDSGKYEKVMLKKEKKIRGKEKKRLEFLQD